MSCSGRACVHACMRACVRHTLDLPVDTVPLATGVDRPYTLLTSYLVYVARLLIRCHGCLNMDYVIGSIHYILFIQNNITMNCVATYGIYFCTDLMGQADGQAPSVQKLA